MPEKRIVAPREPTRVEKLAEAYRRGILPKDKAERFEEGVRRNAIRVDSRTRALVDARRDVSKARTSGMFGAGAYDRVGALGGGQMLGFLDDAAGASSGAAVWVNNVLSNTGLTERKPYSAEDARRAYGQAVREQQQDFATRRPLQSGALNLIGGVASPQVGGKFIQGGKNLLDASLRSGAVGAGYGAVAGAGNAEGGLVERGKGAAVGAAVGAGTGGFVPVGVRGVQALPGAARRVVSGASESGSRVARAFGAKPAPAVVTPAATRRAEEYVAELAARTGRTPEALADNSIAAMGKPITAAEALGRSGMGQLTALGRRSGRTPDALEAYLGPRIDATGERLTDDIAQIAGVDPVFAEGDFVAMNERLRKAAEELYPQAYENNVWSDRLADLARRPSVREAMRRGADIAREDGVDPFAIGLRYEDDLADWASELPQPSVNLNATRRPAGTAPPKESAKGPSLLKRIADGGGIRDDGGELRAMDADVWHRGKAYQRRVVNPDGDTADGWALRLWEEGYFPEFRERPTPRQLLDAVDRELRGNPRFVGGTRAPEPGGSYADELAERAYRGDDGTAVPTPEDYVGRPEPGVVGVSFEHPTMQALDYTKRGLDDLIETYRDKVTRQLNLDTKGQKIVATAKAWRQELMRLNDKYGEALKAGGEPLRLEEAWRKAKVWMGPNTSESQFYQATGKMTKPELDAVLGGHVNDLYARARAGKLKPKDFRNPAYQAKLEWVMGREPAREFMRRVEAEFLLGRGGRMMPGSNSVTSDVQEASRELDRGVGVFANIERRLETSPGKPVSAVLGAVTETAASPVVGFFRGFNSPFNQATRDEIGRLLMLPPEELAKVLSARPAPAPQSFPASGALTAPASAYMAGEAVRSAPIRVEMNRAGWIEQPDGTVVRAPQ